LLLLRIVEHGRDVKLLMTHQRNVLSFIRSFKFGRKIDKLGPFLRGCFKFKKTNFWFYILYVTQIFSALFTGRVSNHVETLAEIGFCIPLPSQRKGKKDREMSRLDLLRLQPGKSSYAKNCSLQLREYFQGLKIKWIRSYLNSVRRW
jgi:hypothetical protein